MKEKEFVDTSLCFRYDCICHKECMSKKIPHIKDCSDYTVSYDYWMMEQKDKIDSFGAHGRML